MSAGQSQNQGNDVLLSDLLDVPDPIKLQSPLPLLNTEEQHRRQLDAGQQEATNFGEADGCYQLQHVELRDILNAPSMDISLRTATDAQEFMSQNMTHDQMLQIERTPEGQPGAMKILDQNKRGIGRYDHQVNAVDEKSFETTYTDGRSSFINNHKQMDMKELERTSSHVSASPVQIGDITYIDASAESSLLTTNQEKKILYSVRQQNKQMMILESQLQSESQVSQSQDPVEISQDNFVIDEQFQLNL